MRSGGTISPHDGSNIYGAGKLKAQCVSSGKTISVVLKATRISAVWFGIAVIAFAVAAVDPALAGKKQKPAKAPEEPVVHVDLKEPMIVVVSIGQQKVDVYRGTTLVTSSAVSTGTSAHPTFIGAFSIMQKARWHHSNIYSNAPMPWMNRLTWSGTAMHAGIVPGYPASHGCIRLTYAFAPKFFQMSSVGDNVITSRGRPKPTPIEHGALFQPLPPPALPMVEKETVAFAAGAHQHPNPRNGGSFCKPGHSGEGRDADHRRQRGASQGRREGSALGRRIGQGRRRRSRQRNDRHRGQRRRDRVRSLSRACHHAGHRARARSALPLRTQRQSRRVPPRTSPPISLLPPPRQHQSPSRPSLNRLRSRSPLRRLICLRLPPPPN